MQGMELRTFVLILHQYILYFTIFCGNVNCKIIWLNSKKKTLIGVGQNSISTAWKLLCGGLFFCLFVGLFLYPMGNRECSSKKQELPEKNEHACTSVIHLWQSHHCSFSQYRETICFHSSSLGLCTAAVGLSDYLTYGNRCCTTPSSSKIDCLKPLSPCHRTGLPCESQGPTSISAVHTGFLAVSYSGHKASRYLNK